LVIITGLLQYKQAGATFDSFKYYNMKLFLLLSRYISNHKLLFTVILILINFSCEKENIIKLDFEFQTTEIIYYPDKHILMTFNILPKGGKEPYTFKWVNPDSLKQEGPFAINISGNQILDFEILDVNNHSQRFTYEINADTIDSNKYDYRNKYIGKYRCKVTYSSTDGSTKQYQDTLSVIKNSSFNMLNILTKSDMKNNYSGNKMTYLNSNGYYNSPTGAFYGYHSGVSFANDSIYYSVQGPLADYYSFDFDGILINK
jgi:hypothetical protein